MNSNWRDNGAEFSGGLGEFYAGEAKSLSPHQSTEQHADQRQFVQLIIPGLTIATAELPLRAATSCNYNAFNQPGNPPGKSLISLKPLSWTIQEINGGTHTHHAHRVHSPSYLSFFSFCISKHVFAGWDWVMFKRWGLPLACFLCADRWAGTIKRVLHRNRPTSTTLQRSEFYTLWPDLVKDSCERGRKMCQDFSKVC